MTASKMNQAAEKVRRGVERSAERPWLERAARLGYAAKGLVYLLIGGLAALAALRAPGGTTTDRSGAMKEIALKPYGWALLGLLAAGLVGYAIWNVVRAIVDFDQRGSDLKGRAIRVGYAAVAVSYVLGAITAVRLLINARQEVDGGVQTWTARLLGQPFGVWLLYAAAGIIGAIAVAQLYRAWSANFAEYLHITPADGVNHAWVVRLGRVGYAARGIVFGLIALTLAMAGLRHNPEQAKGMDDVLADLAAKPYGRLLLGVVAAGLFAYGVFALVQARYRRINR
ncbi:MAG TPA: DUF1206 domain-containing protein [Herpetosiphonaceae bacterium]|nr:DUF1206 domain-containing protein [Herpetosiphonaceae bacterium]